MEINQGDYYVKDGKDNWEILTIDDEGKVFLRAKMFAPPELLRIQGIQLNTMQIIEKPGTENK